MTRDDVHAVIEDLVRTYEGDWNPPVERIAQEYDVPTEADWAYLQEKFDCTFGETFVAFMELITAYNCPGVLNVTREGRTNGDPTIGEAYDHELSFGMWNPDLLPFLAIGDGSFYCLRINAGEPPPVYVCYDSGEEEECAPSFEDWLRRLGEFLNG